jgi:hypothetical protein
MPGGTGYYRKLLADGSFIPVAVVMIIAANGRNVTCFADFDRCQRCVGVTTDDVTDDVTVAFPTHFLRQNGVGNLL